MQLRHYAGVGGVSLAADVGGDPARPPVILMHGGGQTRHAWARAARELIAEGYHVICPDARGHGDSGWAADGNYRLDAFSGDLRAIIAALARPPALIGASLGGGTALLTIGESESPIASALVLVDMVPRPDPVGVSNIVRFMGANPQGFASLEEAADAVTAYAFAIVDEVDNILIDEARTPLIISGAPEQAADLYVQFARLAPRMVSGWS